MKKRMSQTASAIDEESKFREPEEIAFKEGLDQKEAIINEGKVIIENIGEGKLPLIKKPQPIKQEKKFKIIIDPSILLDVNMHGGQERIESTILKSDQGTDKEMEEENLEEMESPQKSDDMEIDDNNDLESSIIKIPSSTVFDNKSEDMEEEEEEEERTEKAKVDDIVPMDPHYARVLDVIIQEEFETLEKEYEDFMKTKKAQQMEKERKESLMDVDEDNSRASKKTSKKNKKHWKRTANTHYFYTYKFMYLLQKRLKKKLISRKTKYMILNPEITEETTMRKTRSTKLPSKFTSLKKMDVTSQTPKLERSNSRRRLNKIQDSPQKLVKIKEDSDEEIKSEEESLKPREEPFDLEMPAEDDAFQDIPIVVHNNTIQVNEIPEIPELPEFKREDDESDRENSETKIKILNAPEFELNPDEDSHLIEDEVQELFKNKPTTEFEQRRSRSSLSEVKVKKEQLKDLLDEDDKDIEMMNFREKKKDEDRQNSGKNILNDLIAEKLPHKTFSENNDDHFFKHQEDIVRDSSNSSMNMSSESLSSSKDDGNDAEATSQDPKRAPYGSLAQYSQDMDEESDLLKESPKSSLKRKARTMQKSMTQVLPSLASLGDIPKNESGIDKLVKEFEDKDRLREKLNRKNIMVKFNEIKRKQYNYENYFTQGDKKNENQNEKKIYVMHVNEFELKIIRKNRNLLLDFGAKLFWEHKYENFQDAPCY